MQKPSEHFLSEIRRECFAKTPLFSPLTADEKQQLASLAIDRWYAAGEILFHEGDACEGLHVIGSGTVKILKTSPSGREIMLALESAPNSVAEVPLFDNGAYPATVAAVRDTVAFLLRKDDFRRFCQQHPEVPIKMLAVVGQRLRVLVRLIEGLTFGSVRQRLARILLDAAEGGRPGEPFSVNITHEELALRLGTAREVVSRNLARFQAEGYIQIVKRQIQLADRAALEAECETEF